MTGAAVLAPSDRAALGGAIRRRRLAHELTLVALAELAGLSQPFLSQVENGRAQPSMASLHRIAQALRTTPQAFFAGAAPLEAVVARAGDAEQVATIATAGESLRRLLLPGDAPFHVIEMVGLATEYLEPWSHEGYEALYVLAGPVEVEVAGEVVALTTGDFISYPAHLPHRYRSDLGAHARLLLIETQFESVPRHRTSDHPPS